MIVGLAAGLGGQHGANCAERPGSCLVHSATVEAGGAGYPRLTITRENWFECVQTLHNEEGDDRTPVVYALQVMGVCPADIVTPDILLFYQSLLACGRLSRIVTPDQYLTLPNVYVEAFRIVVDETKKVEQLRKELRHDG